MILIFVLYYFYFYYHFFFLNKQFHFLSFLCFEDFHFFFRRGFAIWRPSCWYFFFDKASKKFYITSRVKKTKDNEPVKIARISIQDLMTSIVSLYRMVKLSSKEKHQKYTEKTKRKHTNYREVHIFQDQVVFFCGKTYGNTTRASASLESCELGPSG